ncbi:tetratricopeptide repeat protein [Actinoplanes sp. NEAU-A12]|uniref:Tetratricopeptide repeat protein n=1 Tax=Actinoplanes sandaracinus TaxID=3045177 RepID=A0ABT6WSE9_9ACTN|nr:tetratricopeptide repeat protein [Actinoplanes sandaracinus]MDI6102672.1 tetratricopeptide repeat protein [Actinoplanes sandaracinus]
MTTAPQAGDGSVANSITAGAFFGPVIQGRDIHVELPAESRPSLAGLPPASRVFTGRADMVGALREALRPGSPGGVHLVSAVAGMAGIGKTELVLHTAHGALADGWFPGGALFVDMFGYDPGRRLSASDALAGWLAATGIPGERIPAGEQDRSRLWRSVLDTCHAQGRRLLLIIDNASSEDQVRPLLPGSGGIPVLVTSRHTLDLDAPTYDLDVLDPESAVTLISEVVAARRGADDPRLRGDTRAGLADLAERCAGLPLALRIVAALLADRPQLEASALATRLRDGQDRLDGLTRQQVAVRAAFDLSHRNLSSDQARLFRLLPVNPGPDIATRSVAHLAGLPEPRAAALLADLHRAHLIAESAPERWVMHDLLRVYAAERGEETETDRARRRLFGFFQDTARAAVTYLDPAEPDDTRVFTGTDQALSWLDGEHANLVAVVVADHPLTRITTELGFTLGGFLEFRRHLTDWITVTAKVRGLLHQEGDRRGEGRAWNNLGVALREMRRFKEAVEAHTRAYEIFRETRDLHGQGRVWNNVGLALRQVRRFDKAITAHTTARAIYRETSDRYGESRTLNNLGLALTEVRRFEEAIAAHAEARDIAHETGYRRAEARAWNCLGWALKEVDRVDEAIAAHIQAREIFHEIGDLHGEGTALNNLGVALTAAGLPDEAIRAHVQAGDVFRATGDRHEEAGASNNLGIALAEVGRLEEAITAHERSMELYRSVGDQHGVGSALHNLGSVSSEAGRFDQAITAFGQCLEIFSRAGDRHGQAGAWAGLGDAQVRTGAIDEGRASWHRALEAFTEARDDRSAVLIRRHLDGLPPEVAEAGQDEAGDLVGTGLGEMGVVA